VLVSHIIVQGVKCLWLVSTNKVRHTTSTHAYRRPTASLHTAERFDVYCFATHRPRARAALVKCANQLLRDTCGLVLCCRASSVRTIIFFTFRARRKAARTGGKDNNRRNGMVQRKRVLLNAHRRLPNTPTWQQRQFLAALALGLQCWVSDTPLYEADCKLAHYVYAYVR
jgi:hypothetical protein